MSILPTASWFAARILFESSGAGEEFDALIEERIVLFRASTLESARLAAESYSLSEEHEYTNEAGEQIRWRLSVVDEIAVVDDECSEAGWEVLSRFLRRSELSRRLEQS